VSLSQCVFVYLSVIVCLCVYFVSLCMRGTGVRVATRKQLQQALNRAINKRGKFFLVEAMLERGEISDILRRYLNGLSRRGPSAPRP